MNCCEDCQYSKEIKFEVFGREYHCSHGMRTRWGVKVLYCDEYKRKELCSVCHGKGSTTDHHDPCDECGGSGYYD